MTEITKETEEGAATEEEVVDADAPEGTDTPEENKDKPTEDAGKDTPEGDEPTGDEGADEDTPDDTEVGEYNEYEHPALKQAVNILKEASLPVEETNAIFAEAIEAGDLGKVDKAALVDKLGNDKAETVLVLAQSYMDTVMGEVAAFKKAAYELTQGQENYDAMTKWANEKAATDAEFKTAYDDIRSMVDSKNTRAIKAAVTDLFSLYKNDPETTIVADLTVGDKAASTVGMEPLSRAEYTDALLKAQDEGKYAALAPELWKRRQAGMKAGI